MEDRLDHTSQALPPGWLEALERGDADIAAGRVVSSDRIQRKLRAALIDMDAHGPARSDPKSGVSAPGR